MHKLGLIPMSSGVPMSQINLLISLMLIILALQVHGKEWISRSRGHYWGASSAWSLRDDPINYDDYHDIYQEAHGDDYDWQRWHQRGDLASIDALDVRKCGKANFADPWMKKLNSFKCDSPSPSPEPAPEPEPGPGPQPPPAPGPLPKPSRPPSPKPSRPPGSGPGPPPPSSPNPAPGPLPNPNPSPGPDPGPKPPKQPTRPPGGPPAPGDLPAPPPLRGCDKAKKRISGGFLPKLGDYPSMVKVTRGHPLNSCGGVIIHNDLVLTAAYCAQSSDFDGMHRRMQIMAGTTSGNSHDGNGALVEVADQCIAPNYGKIYGSNDWAVLLLSKPLTYSNSIQPACLDFWREPALNVACVTTGFGDVAYEVASQVVRASVMSPCRPSPHYYHPPGTSCYKPYAGKPWSSNLCRGDTGSPMYCFDHCSTSRMYAVGVVAEVTSKECHPNQRTVSSITDVHKLAKEGMMYQLLECVARMRKSRSLRAKRARRRDRQSARIVE